MSLKISSCSVMVGKAECNLRCPYCVSRLSLYIKPAGITRNLSEGTCQALNSMARAIRWPKRFTTAATYGVPLERIKFLTSQFLNVRDGLPYGIITSKGEPTLVPKGELGDVVQLLYRNGLIPELQTNGTLLTPQNMRYWKNRGLNTVALSCVSQDNEVNSEIMSAGQVKWNLGKIVTEAREIGLLVRLTVIMTKDGVDSADAFFAFLKWAEKVGAHQVTFRKMGKPRNIERAGSRPIADWIDANYVDPDFAIRALAGHPQALELDSLPWARKFSFQGMSVAVTEHLTPPKDGLVRSGVIQPNGHLYGSWDDPADILI